MPKYDFIMVMNVAGVETEVDAVAVFDHAQEYVGIIHGERSYTHTVEVYEIYLKVGLDRPNIYLDGLLTQGQYDAIEDEILRSYKI